MCVQHLHSPGLHAQLLNRRVSITPYMTNAMLSSIPLAAGATARAAIMMAVDKGNGGLLITRRTIRIPIIGHAEDMKRVVPL